MRADLLLEHFELLVKTPQDVAVLETAIVELAVHGLLVPQDPQDEPASVLVDRARSDGKRLPPLSPTDSPSDLPAGWTCVRLGQVLELEYGKGLPAKKRDEEGTIPVYGSNGVVGYHTEALVHTACVVVGRKGSSGAINLSLQRCWVIDTAYFVKPPEGIDLEFVCYLLKSLKLETLGKGIKPGLNRTEAYSLVIAIPPFFEQKRIVARVNELLTRTHRLAAQFGGADKALVPAAQASFHALADAKDNAAQREAWQRISDAFDALTDDPRTLDALKQTVLHLAVRGKLVPQDPNDEPVSRLIERMRAERTELVRAREVREGAVLTPISPAETPFSAPSTWEFIGLGDLARFIDYRGRTPPKTDSGLPLITAKNVKMGYIDPQPREYVDPAIYERWMTRGIPRKGDVLFTTEAPLGNVALLPSSDKRVLAQRIIALHPYADMNPSFLMFALMSTPVRRMIFAKATGTTARGIKASRLKRIVIPVPPLDEQKRITAKVESLLALIDALGTEVETAEKVRERLLGAVLNGD